MQALDLEHSLQQSQQISDLIRNSLGEQAQVDHRGRIALAYLTLSLDHREGISLLIRSGAFASATALVRPSLEALVTGAWVDCGASDFEFK
ncbi:DUF6988 family protein [Massilia eburnea]|uniref:DUF6988 family protein n=1 Tax=Massilia eburnea TaxID=1776165 RepID=UPI003D6A297E